LLNELNVDSPEATLMSLLHESHINIVSRKWFIVLILVEFINVITTHYEAPRYIICPGLQLLPFLGPIILLGILPSSILNRCSTFSCNTQGFISL
jgi:hypothetical protein